MQSVISYFLFEGRFLKFQEKPTLLALIWGPFIGRQQKILPNRLLNLKKNSSLLAYKRAESMGRLDRAIVQEARKESNAPKLKSLLS